MKEEEDTNPWGIDCCRELCQEFKVTLPDLKQLQPCIFLAIEHPSHLSRGLVADEERAQRELSPGAQEDADAIAQAESIRAHAN